jgi:glycosidase
MIPGSEWVKAIMDEYPNFNIVGECWTRPAPAVAYWQSGTHNYNGFDSHLKSVMDFPLEEAIRQALETDGNGWGNGLTRVYDAMSMDYLYGDVNNIMIMLGNHDMDRIADVVKDQDPRRIKLAYTLLATMRGIPQVFYGDEYAMKSSDRSLGHSTLRMPLPLGDEVTAEQQDMFDYQSRLFQWRKGEPVIHTGRTMHFMSRDNTYAFFRYNDGEAVFVFANASEDNRTIPTAHYAEILGKYNPVGVDVISGKTYDLSKKDIVIAPLSSIVVKLAK